MTANAVSTTQILDGSVFGNDLAAGSVTRSKLAALIPLHRVVVVVCPFKEPTLDPECSTALCNPVDDEYFACSGACTAPSPRSCPNAVVGYLVAP